MLKLFFLSIVSEYFPFSRHFLFQAKIKKQYKEEETKFFQEISRFNTEFSLLGEEDGDFQILLQTMNQDLEKEVESLRAGHKGLE